MIVFITFVAVRWSFLPEASFVQPSVLYLQDTVNPKEVTRCPGEVIGTSYDFIVRRPTIARVSHHYIPLGSIDEAQEPILLSTTSLIFYKTLGRHTYPAPTRVPTTLKPGSYQRYVVAQFDDSLLTSYNQVLHVVPCEEEQ